MPELPEVEVVKRSLEKKILKLIIKDVKINDGNLRYKVDKAAILNLKGKKIIKITRRSKFLIFELEDEFFMLVHLGMTGKFFFADQYKRKFKTSFYYNINNVKDEKHDRIIFIFHKNQRLIYNDVRKFGFIKFIRRASVDQNSHLKLLGPEPLSTKFNIKYFKNYIIGKERTIKDLLMDQKFISGLGNIYVNEILFFSGVRPTKKIKKLTNSEIQKIIKFSKKIITKAIILGGSSIKDFSSGSGKKGLFQQHFSVYGKKGENCSNVKCLGKIKKIVIANRASFFCSKCQK